MKKKDYINFYTSIEPNAEWKENIEIISKRKRPTKTIGLVLSSMIVIVAIVFITILPNKTKLKSDPLKPGSMMQSNRYNIDMNVKRDANVVIKENDFLLESMGMDNEEYTEELPSTPYKVLVDETIESANIFYNNHYHNNSQSDTIVENILTEDEMKNIQLDIEKVFELVHPEPNLGFNNKSSDSILIDYDNGNLTINNNGSCWLNLYTDKSTKDSEIAYIKEKMELYTKEEMKLVEHNDYGYLSTLLVPKNSSELEEQLQTIRMVISDDILSSSVIFNATPQFSYVDRLTIRPLEDALTDYKNGKYYSSIPNSDNLNQAETVKVLDESNIIEITLEYLDGSKNVEYYIPYYNFKILIPYKMFETDKVRYYEENIYVPAVDITKIGIERGHE